MKSILALIIFFLGIIAVSVVRGDTAVRLKDAEIPDTIYLSRTDTVLKVDSVFVLPVDTVHVVRTNTGPLTDEMLANIICSDFSTVHPLKKEKVVENIGFGYTGGGYLTCPLIETK